MLAPVGVGTRNFEPLLITRFFFLLAFLYFLPMTFEEKSLVTMTCADGKDCVTLV